MKRVLAEDSVSGVRLIEMTLDGNCFNYLVELPAPHQVRTFTDTQKKLAYDCYNEKVIAFSKRYN